MSDLESTFELHLKAAKIGFRREVAPVPGRRWRVDFLIGNELIVEIEGGVWTNGRHTRGQGFIDDCEKYNTLTTMGYRVLRVTSEHIQSGEALKWVEEALYSIKAIRA